MQYSSKNDCDEGSFLHKLNQQRRLNYDNTPSLGNDCYLGLRIRGSNFVIRTERGIYSFTITNRLTQSTSLLAGILHVEV